LNLAKIEQRLLGFKNLIQGTLLQVVFAVGSTGLHLRALMINLMIRSGLGLAALTPLKSG